jgi:hypothetical protein
MFARTPELVHRELFTNFFYVCSALFVWFNSSNIESDQIGNMTILCWNHSFQIPLWRIKTPNGSISQTFFFILLRSISSYENSHANRHQSSYLDIDSTSDSCQNIYTWRRGGGSLLGHIRKIFGPIYTTIDSHFLTAHKDCVCVCVHLPIENESIFWGAVYTQKRFSICCCVYRPPTYTGLLSLLFVIGIRRV